MGHSHHRTPNSIPFTIHEFPVCGVPLNGFRLQLTMEPEANVKGGTAVVYIVFTLLSEWEMKSDR